MRKSCCGGERHIITRPPPTPSTSCEDGVVSISLSVSDYNLGSDCSVIEIAVGGRGGGEGMW